MKFVGLVASIVSAGLIASAAPVSAAEQASDAKARINLAGRQRMLSQKMAKASCFALVDGGNFAHMNELDKARETFEETHTGLVEGSAALSLNAEAHDTVLAALSDVASLWAPFQSAVADILTAGKVDESKLSVVGDTNLPVLVRMNETVGLIADTYATGGDIDPARGNTINVAGRQRMLSQKMAKEFCMILAGFEEGTNREALQSTMSQFETALGKLIAGADGLEVPNPAIGSRLERVGKVYESIKVSYEGILAGETPSAEEIASVSSQSNRVLREMNQIVFAYSVVE